MTDAVLDSSVGRTPSGHARRRVFLLVLILLVFGALKLTYGPGYGPYGADGNYYFQVARHVAEGRGLLTSVSLYHQGLRHMPQETSIYPLWPLLLGYAAHFGGLIAAVNWLPRSIYLLDLVLLYFLGNRMAQQSWGIAAELPFARVQWIDCGHLLVLLFGSTSLFFTSTTFPYTEGLCFLFLFAALFSLTWIEEYPLASAVAAGALTGLAYLTRTQMLALFVGSVLALLLRPRTKTSKAGLALAFSATCAIVVLPWILFLRSFIRPFRPAVLLDFSAYRETPQIAPFDQLVRSDSWIALVLDRLAGLATAWDAGSEYSFFALFGAAAALAPLGAAVGLIARLRKSSGVWRSALGVSALAATVTALIVFGMLLTFHSSFFLPWFFGYRHGLPFFLAIAVASTYLLSLHRLVYTLVTLVAILISVATGLSDLGIREARVLKMVGPGEGYLSAARFLDSLPARGTVIAQEAQLMSVYSRANFHWIACHDSPEVTRSMMRHLEIDFVLVEERRRRCRFLNGMGDVLAVDRVVGPPHDRVFLLRKRTSGSQVSALQR